MLGGGGVSHPSQLTTGLVIKSVTTSPTLAGERMLFILQVSILSEQTHTLYTTLKHFSYNIKQLAEKSLSTGYPATLGFLGMTKLMN